MLSGGLRRLCRLLGSRLLCTVRLRMDCRVSIPVLWAYRVVLRGLGSSRLCGRLRLSWVGDDGGDDEWMVWGSELLQSQKKQVLPGAVIVLDSAETGPGAGNHLSCRRKYFSFCTYTSYSCHGNFFRVSVLSLSHPAQVDFALGTTFNEKSTCFVPW